MQTEYQIFCKLEQSVKALTDKVNAFRVLYDNLTQDDNMPEFKKKAINAVLFEGLVYIKSELNHSIIKAAHENPENNF